MFPNQFLVVHKHLVRLQYNNSQRLHSDVPTTLSSLPGIVSEFQASYQRPPIYLSLFVGESQLIFGTGSLADITCTFVGWDSSSCRAKRKSVLQHIFFHFTTETQQPGQGVEEANISPTRPPFRGAVTTGESQESSQENCKISGEVQRLYQARAGCQALYNGLSTSPNLNPPPPLEKQQGGKLKTVGKAPVSKHRPKRTHTTTTYCKCKPGFLNQMQFRIPARCAKTKHCLVAS